MHLLAIIMALISVGAGLIAIALALYDIIRRRTLTPFTATAITISGFFFLIMIVTLA